MSCMISKLTRSSAKPRKNQTHGITTKIPLSCLALPEITEVAIKHHISIPACVVFVTTVDS